MMVADEFVQLLGLGINEQNHKHRIQGGEVVGLLATK